MKIGYTLWTWLMDEHNDWADFSQYKKRDFEQSLRDISDLGYQVFENFNMIVDMYEDSPEEFDALCQKYNLEFVNVYHYIMDDFEADMVMAERCCKFLNRHHASIMNLEAPRIRPRTESTEEDLKSIVHQTARMGKLAHSYGVQLCLHPHWGTSVYHESDIDYLLAHTDPEQVSLCMDTAHIQMGGMDPVRVFEKYFSRMKVVHLKDLDPLYQGEYAPRAFKALGEGAVDFRGVYSKLVELNYQGNLIVELDFQRVNNYESAMVSRDFIHRVMGL